MGQGRQFYKDISPERSSAISEPLTRQEYINLLKSRMDNSGQCVLSGYNFSWFLRQSGKDLNNYGISSKVKAYELARELGLEIIEG